MSLHRTLMPLTIPCLRRQGGQAWSGTSVPSHQPVIAYQREDASCLNKVARWLEYGLDPLSGQEVIQRYLGLG